VGFVPKGTKFRSIEPAQNQAQAVSWTTHYDYVGLVSIPAHLADLPTPFLFDHLPPDLKAVSCDGIIGWSSFLRNGQALKDKFGEKVGFHYSNPGRHGIVLVQ
jgi:hypothetical protein